MNERPTRVRYSVLGFLCVLSMITYLDRVCFGSVASTLAAELSLSSVADLKWAFTAFGIAYALFEIPTGWLGDVWGPRRTLLRIVIWWSIFTALTAIVGLQFGSLLVGGLGTLIVIRFLFGAGEAGAFPNITRAVHNWFPANRAATAQGWIWMSGRLTGGLTPMLWTVLVVGTAWTPPLVHWRGAFLLFGLVGMVWCALFAYFFRDSPHDHPRVNDAEKAEIERHRDTSQATHVAVPIREIVSSTNVWLICLMYFCMVYGWYFHVTYLPSYLKDRFHLDPQSVIGALYTGAPLWLGAFSCLLGGILVDWLIRRTGSRQRARRLVGMVAQGLCALGWIAALFATNLHVFTLAISVAALCNDVTLASAWATCQDIGGRYTAVTAACMNTAGASGAAAVGWATGTIIEQVIAAHASDLDVAVAQLSASEQCAAVLAGFDYNFMSYAAVYVVSTFCWRFIDFERPITSIDKIATTP